jgi:hypothetical protein
VVLFIVAAVLVGLPVIGAVGWLLIAWWERRNL